MHINLVPVDLGKKISCLICINCIITILVSIRIKI